MSEFTERLWYPGPAEGVGMKLLRAPLHLAAAGFGAGVAARNALFERGWLASVKVPGARVLSVGNLNVGGAGKTQVVIWLANELLARGEKVAVLSRGYGRSSTALLSFDAASAPSPDEAGDEPVLIAHRCAGARVHVGADRRALAAQAVAQGASVLVLDDGMQHRRLARDEELVVMDEAGGLGNGALMPAGPLREPPGALRRATLLWLRASEGAAAAMPADRSAGPGGQGVAALRAFAGPVVRARHSPVSLVAPDGTEHPVDGLRGQRAHLLSALARPASFRRTVEGLGARVTGETRGADHHAWQPDELALATRTAQSEAARLVTTEKDRVKLPPDAEVWVVRLGVELLSGQAHLERILAGGPRAG